MAIASLPFRSAYLIACDEINTVVKTIFLPADKHKSGNL
jgi:hypothetical protein